MSYQQYGGGPPSGPPPSNPQDGLPKGWIARWDSQSQHWFYVEESSGRTQWDRPGQQNYAPPANPPSGNRDQYGGGGQQYGGGGQQYGGGGQQYGGGGSAIWQSTAIWC